MNSKTMQQILIELFDEVGVEEVRRVETFDEAGIYTTDAGLIVHTKDGSEFQITITQRK